MCSGSRPSSKGSGEPDGGRGHCGDGRADAGHDGAEAGIEAGPHPVAAGRAECGDVPGSSTSRAMTTPTTACGSPAAATPDSRGGDTASARPAAPLQVIITAAKTASRASGALFVTVVRHQGDDEGDLDVRDGHGDHQGAEGLAHPVCGPLGVVDRGQDHPGRHRRHRGHDRPGQLAFPGETSRTTAGGGTSVVHRVATPPYRTIMPRSRRDVRGTHARPTAGTVTRPRCPCRHPPSRPSPSWSPPRRPPASARP